MKTLFISILIFGLSSCEFVNPHKSKLIFVDKTTAVVKTLIPKDEVENQFKNEEVKDDVVYNELKNKLFDKSCIGCHGARQESDDENHLDFTKKNVILENIENIIYSTASAVDGGIASMPLGGDRVSPEIIKELKVWGKDQVFANIYKSLFVESCIKCHGSTAKINLTSKEVIVENYDKIIDSLERATGERYKMPPGNTVISKKLIQEFKNWKDK
jgi:mono/diheme cytochrome c family protein